MAICKFESMDIHLWQGCQNRRELGHRGRATFSELPPASLYLRHGYLYHHAQDLEMECLKSHSTVLPEIGLALLKFVSSHRGLT